MANESKLEAWKTFLQGRIAQERGDEEKALKAFDQAIHADPNNSYFLRSKSIALSRLHRVEPSEASGIASAYAELAQKHSGDHDKPEPWIKGLETLLGETDKGLAPVAGKHISTMVCW